MNCKPVYYNLKFPPINERQLSLTLDTQHFHRRWLEDYGDHDV